MKIGKNMIIAFMIGAIVGGSFIGFLDYKKINPLYSSAAVPECQHLVSQYNLIITQMNERPIDPANWDALFDNLDPAYLDIQSCTASICDPFDDYYQQYNAEIVRWEEIIDDLVQQRDQFEESNPQPWSRGTQASYQNLISSIFDAEDQITHYTGLLEDIRAQYSEAGCEQNWESELHDYDPRPDGNEDGSGTGTNSY